MTSLVAERDLESDVTQRRPSNASNNRTLVGVDSRALTRQRSVLLCIAGHIVGSRRSSKSCPHISTQFPRGSELRSYIHVDLSIK